MPSKRCVTPVSASRSSAAVRRRDSRRSPTRSDCTRKARRTDGPPPPRSTAAWVFTIDEWLLVDPAGRYVAHERHTVGFDARVVPDFQGVSGIGKIVGSSADPGLLKRAADALHPRLSTHAHAALSQTYYLDVTHADANKGAALRAIAAHAGLALDEMAAIGDMANDLAMLEIAGFAIAMGNAPDEVKRATDAVTDSNRDDGFAKAVTKLVLPRAARETR